MNIMLLITTNYAQNVASTIYQSLLDHSRKYHTICLSIIYDQLPTGWCLTIIWAEPRSTTSKVHGRRSYKYYGTHNSLIILSILRSLLFFPFSDLIIHLFIILYFWICFQEIVASKKLTNACVLIKITF